MPSIRMKVILAVLVSISFGVAAAWAKPDDAQDSAAIKKLVSDFDDAFNNHQAHAVSMLFTDDADFINVAGATTHARTGVEEHLAPLYAGRLKNIHRDVSNISVRFLSPEIATVDSNYETTGAGNPDGSAQPPTKGFYDWIVVKKNGRWMIAVWHESNLPAPAPTK